MAEILQESYIKVKTEKECQAFPTIPDYLKHFSETKQGDEAVVFVSTDGKRESVTWMELYSKSCKTARSLVGLGLKKGEVVAVNIRSCPEWLYATFGAMIAGAIPMSVSFTYTDGSDFIALMEKLQTCSMLIMDPGHENINWNILRQHLDEFDEHGNAKSRKMPYLRYLIGSAFEGTGALVLNFTDLLCQDHSEVTLPKLETTDVSCLFQTSGSTGVPKVVAHTHGSHINTVTARHIEIMDPKYKLFNDRPFTWAGGFPYSLLTGQTRVTTSGQCDLPSDKISFMVKVIDAEKCTSLFILPPALHQLIKRQDELPTNWPIEVIMSGGQPMTKQSAACIGKCCKSLICMYGSTELTALAKILITNPKDFTEFSCGKPMRYPGFEIKIVDENGSIVPVNTRGEIYARSPYMFKEYFNDPVKTKAAKTDDGWFRMDDIGRITENGEIIVEGRKSNMIISGGFNVAPEILEQVMKTFAGVESVVIVPIPDDTYYQVLCACVVKKEGSDVTEEKLKKSSEDFHADKPGLFTVLPKFYLFFDRFPETTTGKLNRKAVEKIAQQRLKLHN